MNTYAERPTDPDVRFSGRLLDVLIRAGLIAAMVVLCYRIFAPFISLMAWAVILAVTLYPAQQRLARSLGGRQGLAATLLVSCGIVLIVLPTAVLLMSLGDSVHDFFTSVVDKTFRFPSPSPEVAEWPLVGKRIHGLWSQASADLPSLLHGMQLRVPDLAAKALEMASRVAVAILMFLISFIVAGIVMAFGQSGAASTRSIFGRVMDPRHGEEFARLCTATIRAVAQGVLGVAFIQSIVVGVILLLSDVPFPGILALITLVLGIAQVPALLVTLPVIGYIWTSGTYGMAASITWTLLLIVAGMLDNVLKPLMLGRGVDAPMPVILLGALGGMASGGILGMFVGATLLALGYQIFMWWVAVNPDTALTEGDQPPAG